MAHPLVDQLRFTRLEWRRALEGVSEEEALKRFPPINCLGWMAGHLAWHEHRYWIRLAQGRSLAPQLDELAASGGPSGNPPLGEMLALWEQVTREADPFLDTLTPAALVDHLVYKDKPVSQSTGTMLQRLIYHYWFHIGESQAVRQLLGHTDLPVFVGDIGGQAPYRPG